MVVTLQTQRVQTLEEVRHVAEVDAALGRRCGLTTRAVLRRQYEVIADERFVRLAGPPATLWLRTSGASTMPAMLFCNIARMDSYRGRTAIDIPYGAGSHPEKEEVHNFLPHNGHVYGYVAAVSRAINLENLGAGDRNQPSIGNVDVIWTAPSTSRGRDVVGWYRHATVFHDLQTYKRGSYHVKANMTDYVLLPPNKRTLNISSARDRKGGFGNSNVWYADSEYGQDIRRRVTRLFRRAKRQLFDRDELDAQADALELLPHAPNGVGRPSRSKREVTVIGRDPEVQRWILQCADGRCELCGKRAPFHKPNGLPFLEIHHVCRLADGGADVPENAVALCPNCHREAHHGDRAETIRNRLLEHASQRSHP